MLLEKELIYECICGNRKAQKELYEKYSPRLFTTCMRYMPTREDAEDVLIMGFTSIFAKLDTYKEEGSFEGWMKRIIVNTAIDALRQSNKQYEVGDEYEKLEQMGTFKIKDMIYSKINAKDIIKQIQQLSAGYRVVFNLYAVEGYSYEEISDKLGVSIGTIRSQIAKARKILQKKLQDFK